MAEDIKYMAKWIENQSLKTVDKMKRTLIAGGNAVQSKARKKCPVNTGHLRQSITSTANFLRGDLEVVIGTTVKYGPFVEFGTTRTKGRPYLIPAFNEVEPKVHDKLEKILQETGENG